MTATVVVTGSRDPERVSKRDVWQALDTLGPTLVLVGCCRTGADHYARRWCRAHDVRVEVFQANWAQYGRGAGPRRNQRMIDAAPRHSTVLAFPRGGAGTADCVRRARIAGLRVVER